MTTEQQASPESLAVGILRRERAEAWAKVAVLTQKIQAQLNHPVPLGAHPRGSDPYIPCVTCEWYGDIPTEARALLDQQANLEGQIKRLADFIVAKVPGEPSKSEGAVDTAIRLLDRLQRAEAVVGAARRWAVRKGHGAEGHDCDLCKALAAWEERKA